MTEEEARGVGEVPEDLWAGMTDETGVPLDEVYGEVVGPHEADVAGALADATLQEQIAARYRLPEEFWGARELFKTIRQAAWATQTHPDAVLACVLARAAGAAGHEVTFDTGKGPATMSLFACLLSRSGVGKSEAMKAATRLVQLPSHLCRPDGSTDMEVFRDGLGIGSGEGLAEAYMGVVERDTGRLKPAKRGQPAEPETVKVREAVRHRAFFCVDEGETLTKLMSERQGSTLGPNLRIAWSGAQLGQQNATEDRWRHVPAGSYTMGVVIGYQPDVAVALLSDVGPGTPQRFLWFGAQDTEMPDPDEEEFDFPERVTLPPEGSRAGVIHFPREIRRWFRRQVYGKHRGLIEVDPMNSHEPLTRAKLAALLCWLDGRWLVNRDDWTLAAMIWSVSVSIRDRLIRHRDAEAERRVQRKREERLEEAAEVAMVQVTVSHDVERAARRIAGIVREAEERFEQPDKTWKLRKDFGRDKKFFDPALAHARREGWIAADDGSGYLTLGESRP